MREYLLVCVVAAVFTYAATPLARFAAVKFGAVTPVRSRDVHVLPIPRLGGAAMFIGFVAAVGTASQLPYLSKLFHNEQLLGTLIAVAMMFGLGAWDDFMELNWAIKFGGQALAALVLVASGVQMVFLPIGRQTVLPTPLLVGITVLTVLVVVNAVNWVDGLDGLAAGMVGIAALSFFFIAYQRSEVSAPGGVFTTATFLSAATVGCCLGFIPHNFHPARLFMGDAGSLFLGMLISAATISFTGDADPSVNVGKGNPTIAYWLPVLVPFAILAVPLWDFAASIFRRIRQGQKPWEADGRHLHHRMMKIGHSHRAAVLLLYMWSTGIALGIVSMAYLPMWMGTLFLLLMTVSAYGLTWGLPRWRRRRTL